MRVTRVRPLARTPRMSSSADPTWESWWQGLKAASKLPTRPRFSADKARKFITYKETKTTFHKAMVLLLFPVPGLLAALVAPLVPLQDPSEEVFANIGFLCHAQVTVGLNMIGALMEIRAVTGITDTEYSNLEIGVAGVLGAFHVVVVEVFVALAWQFPVPFAWIVLAVPWLVFLMWGSVLVLRTRLRRIRMRLLFALPQLAVQLGQIALYPAYSALFEASNEWQQLLLIAIFPLLKMALKRSVFAVSHHLSDYARETAISGVEISASMYQAMIMQSSPTLLATALVIGFDLVQGVYDLTRLMERSTLVSRQDLIETATRILNQSNSKPRGSAVTKLQAADAGTHPIGPQNPVEAARPSETRSRNAAILGQALELLQSAETILLIEYIEVAVPVTNAVFLCVAYNGWLAPIRGTDSVSATFTRLHVRHKR